MNQLSEKNAPAYLICTLGIIQIGICTSYIDHLEREKSGGTCDEADNDHLTFNLYSSIVQMHNYSVQTETFGGSKKMYIYVKQENGPEKRLYLGEPKEILTSDQINFHNFPEIIVKTIQPIGLDGILLYNSHCIFRFNPALITWS